MKSAFVLAAPHSGAGKTTVTLSLLAALTRRGVGVQSFKVGPDYIDPLHHALITGRPAHNLDTWMLGKEANREIFANAAEDCEVALIEGVMGLYDGVDGQRQEGSTAHLAKTLGLPVILVIDARSMARSAAALALGFVKFDPEVEIAGIIWNRTGSPAHRRILEEAARSIGLPPTLGCYGREPGLGLGERHLGLVTPTDAGLPPDWSERLAAAAEGAVEIDRLLSLTRRALPPPAEKTHPAAKTRTIAVARDRAFCFYYEENFRTLERLGARLAFFAPTEGEAIPESADALYLGGGYPELHAKRLSENRAFMEGLRALHGGGAPIYAECGGFMTLCASLETGEGERVDLAGIFPGETKMGKRLARLGYREVSGRTGTAFAGMTARGHEFHYSEVSGMAAGIERVYEVRNARGEALEAEGYRAGSALGGYIHLHFASNPAFAAKLFGLGQRG